MEVRIIVSPLDLVARVHLVPSQNQQPGVSAVQKLTERLNSCGLSTVIINVFEFDFTRRNVGQCGPTGAIERLHNVNRPGKKRY